jgi:hypothetical protein
MARKAILGGLPRTIGFHIRLNGHERIACWRSRTGMLRGRDVSPHKSILGGPLRTIRFHIRLKVHLRIAFGSAGCLELNHRAGG